MLDIDWDGSQIGKMVESHSADANANDGVIMTRSFGLSSIKIQVWYGRF